MRYRESSCCVALNHCEHARCENDAGLASCPASPASSSLTATGLFRWIARHTLAHPRVAIGLFLCFNRHVFVELRKLCR